MINLSQKSCHMLAGSAGDAKREADFWKMVLNEPENHKPAQGEFFFYCQPSAFSPCSEGTALHSYRFFFFYSVIALWIFSPRRHSIIMHFILRLFFISCRAKGECVSLCVSLWRVINEWMLWGRMCGSLDEHPYVWVRVCVAFFNNVLSIWALGTAIFTQSHNRDPAGGRISHQPLAKSPPAP